MKKVLFFDIDGTVVSDITKKVPKSACRVLKQAKENGHMLFINTGRTMSRIVPELKELPFDGFLCGCGIYLTYHEEVFFEKYLPQQFPKQVIDMARKCNVDGVFESAENVYYFSEKSRFANLEKVKERLIEEGLGENRFVEQYIEREGKAFDKMFIKTDERSDKERFLKFVSQEMDVIDRENGAYECIPKGFSKATAMEMVCEKFGIDRENTYAFGDSSNDIPMFEFAKHTIAMGCHSVLIEPYTEFITKTVEDDGIEYAMKHYGLI